MARFAFLLAVTACWLATSSVSRATVRSLNKLPLDRRLAYEESERRLITYDHALMALDQAVKTKKISRQEYAYDEYDLRAYILAEARFQNEILKNETGSAEAAREVMQNIAKYAVEVPAFILAIAARCVTPGASGSFSP